MKKEDIPQYKKIYQILRKHIDEGIYNEGDLLPSENELCAIHEITRPTVRHALDALVNAGYIRKHKGKGSIVNALPQGIGILSITGTTSAIGKENLTTEIILKPEVKSWPESFAFTLSDEEKESGCIHLERLRKVKKSPVFYDTNYIPNMNMPRFTSRNLDGISLFEVLREHYQIEVNGGEQHLKAIPASKKIAKYFKITKGDPVLYIERKLHTNRPGFFIYSLIYCHTERHSVFGTF